MKTALTLLLVLSLSLAACDRRPAPPPTTTPATATAEPLPAAASDADALTGVARHLAGVESEPALPHAEVWRAHAAAMDETWGKLERAHLAGMRPFAAAQLADLAAAPKPLFYPFAGPDFLNAIVLFPEAPSLTLVGLEPPGHVPDPAALGADTLGVELARLHDGLETIVEYGYFQTTRMGRDFETGKLDGMLPVLLIFLAYTGHEPLSIRYLDLAGDGTVHELDTVTPAAGAAVRITFRRHGSDERRTLDYFSQDLSNDALAARPAFGRHVDRLAPYHTYMKSASYLLHMPEFSTLADQLLAGASAVLEDDSGLPLRRFRHDVWDLRFFGTYTQTLPAYRDYFQKDLYEVYQLDADVGPLDFAIGYHTEIGGGCLILARKRNPR